MDAVPWVPPPPRGPPLFATTATCSRGSTATPIGFVPTPTVVPVAVDMLRSASELHPNSVTATRFCRGSMETPAGCGAGHEVLLTSTLSSTVKSSAFVIWPLVRFKTSRANRWAEVKRLAGTVAVSTRLPVPEQEVDTGWPSSRTVKLPVHVSPVPITVSVCGDGLGPEPSVDEVMNVFGLVSEIEKGWIGPKFKMLTLLSVWLAMTAMFVPASTATAEGPQPFEHTN